MTTTPATITAGHLGHQCEATWDEADQPTPDGTLTITERCHCGAAVRTYKDSVL